MPVSPGNSTSGIRASRVHRFTPGPVRGRVGLRGAGVRAVCVLRGRETSAGPARSARDEDLKKEIRRVWEDREKGRRVYGARKVWRQLHREGIEVARCMVERLMREMGIAGASARRKKPRTTVPGPAVARPADLLERDFTAVAPGRRRVADITYVEITGGFACTSFATDLFSRRIVGWQVSDTLRCLQLAEVRDAHAAWPE